MALRFIDGFDHYTSADTLKKWTTWSNTVGPSVTGRFSGSTAIRMQSRTLYKTIDAQQTWILGFALNSANTPGNNGDQIVGFLDAGTTQVDVVWDGLGHFRVRRGGSTVLGTGTFSIPTGVWIYVEIKVVIDDTVGAITLKVNGVTDISLTGIDTKQSANATADTIFINGSNPPVHDIDDLYLCDGQGSSPYNDFLGDVRVETLMPNGNGNSSQLQGSDGNSTDNYLLVDETTPNSDTDYVQSSTVGDKDTYAYANLATTTGTVYAVAPIPYMEKTNAGSRSVCTVARLSATEVDSSDIAVPSSYSYPRQDIRTTKPGGGSWSVSDVNSAEFGIKVTA